MNNNGKRQNPTLGHPKNNRIGRNRSTIALHIYPSGNIKVRCPSGHIIIIRPSEVTANLGYRKSAYDGLIAMLINNRYYGKSKN